MYGKVFMKLVWYNHLKINEVIDDKLLLPNHSTVTDFAKFRG